MPLHKVELFFEFERFTNQHTPYYRQAILPQKPTTEDCSIAEAEPYDGVYVGVVLLVEPFQHCIQYPKQFAGGQRRIRWHFAEK